ncbi:hypothetical protein BaRGS_00028148 [Batillaria attramentaria]|uniref:Uncharacterized protein n=1 Tax=Batillaria attramentaria TaxID=370345 RepID=A0ABD0K142_9CAEN
MQLQSQLDTTHAVIRSLRLEMHNLQNDVTSIIHRVDNVDSDVRDNAVKTANGLKLAQACLNDQLGDLEEQLVSLSAAHKQSQDSVIRLSSAKDSHGSLLRDVIKRVDKIEKNPSPSLTPAHSIHPSKPSCAARPRHWGN